MRRIITIAANVLMAFYLISLFSIVSAQELPLLHEKQGTFEILSRTDYTSYDCGFTKAEITENLQRITELVSTMRKNTVLSDIKGFNGRARIYNVSCKDVDAFGVPSRISFEFSDWFRSKTGAITYNTIEPPQWSLYINKLVPIDAFSSDIFDSKNCYFTVPHKKETLAPGIDVYDEENFVIYDPSRPSYWLPVTVNEAFAAVRDFYKRQNNPDGNAMILRMIEEEYAAIPESERNSPAFFGGMIARVSSKPYFQNSGNIFPPIMKINPEYWNRELPKASIQFIYFQSVQNKEYLRKQTEECMEHAGNNGGCSLRRFNESFDLEDIRRLVPLIE